jgi:glycyl-tRNA synthetase beta chain
MTTQNLLVELFVEELPPKALKKLGESFAGVLPTTGPGPDLGRYRRHALCLAAPPGRAHQPRLAQGRRQGRAQQKLMPVAVGLDAAGHPTPALLKKLAALGADVTDPATLAASLKRAPDGKAEALFYDSLVTGATLDDGLQKALDEAIAKLPIPKVMSYQLRPTASCPAGAA